MQIKGQGVSKLQLGMQRSVRHGVQTAEGRGARVFNEELTAGRAASDIYGLTIDLVANLAVLYRALPLVAWDVAAGKAAYLLALAALLSWNQLARKSYVRWRTVVYTVLRLHAFLDPNSRQIWATFVNQPPVWQKGALADPLNLAALLASLLGQSWAGLMALFALSHAVPLWLHLPVQLACLALAATHNHSFCSSAILDNETAPRLVQTLYSCMDQLFLVIPLPIWPVEPVPFPTACRRLALMKQLVVGLILPTLLLCYLECRSWRKHCAQQGQQQAQREQQRQQGQQQMEEEGQGLVHVSFLSPVACCGVLAARARASIDSFYLLLLRVLEPLVLDATAVAQLGWVVMLLSSAWVLVCVVIS